MPQTCTICKHPRRLEIEQAIVAGTSLRTIAGQYGPSKTAVMRHRTHVVDALAHSSEAREMVRTGSLLESVRTGEQRGETLYEKAQEILSAALSNDDPRTALQAIRTAIAVMSEARGYLELRGEISNELGRNRVQGTMQIQIVLPGAGNPDGLPRISYAAAEAIEAPEDCVATIGMLQRP